MRGVRDSSRLRVRGNHVLSVLRKSFSSSGYAWLLLAVLGLPLASAAEPILSNQFIEVPCTRAEPGALRANGSLLGSKCELGLPRCEDVKETLKASIEKGIQDYLDAAYRYGVLIDFKKSEDFFANPAPGKAPGDKLTMNVCSLQYDEGSPLATLGTYKPNKMNQSCGKTLAIAPYGSAIGSAATTPGSSAITNPALAPGSWEEAQKWGIFFDSMRCVMNSVVDQIGENYRLQVPVGLESLAAEFQKLYTQARTVSAQNTKTYFKLLEGTSTGATIQNLCDQQNLIKDFNDFIPAYCSKDHLSENSSNPQDASQRQSTCYLATSVKLAMEGFVRIAIGSIRILADVHYTRLTFGDNSPLAGDIKNFVMSFRNQKVEACVRSNIHIDLRGIHFNRSGAENCWQRDIQEAYDRGIINVFKLFEETHVPKAGKCDVH